MLVYVDDIIITGNDVSQCNKIIHHLGTLFPMKDLGALKKFLGLQVTRNFTGLFLCQTKYTIELLQKCNLVGIKPCTYPSPANFKLSASNGDLLTDPTKYKSLVGSLQYLTWTRPDISYEVNQICQFMHVPTTTHLQVAKRVLRISVSGYCIFFGGNPISWSSKKQPIVPGSSIEAEYESLAFTVAEVLWICHILKDLYIFIPTPPSIACDNQSSIALASNPAADIFTKGLSTPRFEFLKNKLKHNIICKRVYYESVNSVPLALSVCTG
ncbi:uncharacterized protein LOC113305543 [Papaver somniferum]|uniref:uncharacterized protein LOC113305543 n=1 Tax=Papaver somniferum TaxID=3469 RepID=UPI000E6FDE72|nr:uncharacterized protein LOC113305543 [Papaver somniferum]